MLGHWGFTLVGFGTVGVKSLLAALGESPETVPWFGLLPDVDCTSPPAALISPALQQPTCPFGTPFDNSSTDLPGAVSTEKPVTPDGCVPVPAAIPSGLLAPPGAPEPPRTTLASSGIAAAGAAGAGWLEELLEFNALTIPCPIPLPAAAPAVIPNSSEAHRSLRREYRSVSSSLAKHPWERIRRPVRNDRPLVPRGLSRATTQDHLQGDT